MMRFRFTPLFFLPRNIRILMFQQAMAEHLLDTPFGWLFWSADDLGIEFWHRGDTVIWTWPWKRKGLAPFISVGFSGTGEWGDARFWSLKELDRDWNAFFEACNTQAAPIAGCTFPLFAGSPNYYHRFQQALEPMINEILAEQDKMTVEALMTKISKGDISENNK